MRKRQVTDGAQEIQLPTKRPSRRKQAQPAEIDQLLTMTQAAARLSIGRTKLYALINSNQLPYVEIPGPGEKVKRISVVTLNAWIKARETVKHVS